MVGNSVTEGLMNQRSAEAVVQVREAFRSVRTVKAALDNIPSDVNGADGLTQGDFNYTPDEAYLLRRIFGDLSALDVQPILDMGRKLTGLE